tara:strand:+ start:3437 stop:4225 length:789 start_codon:yes stop_codon:yes gene_type:complete
MQKNKIPKILIIAGSDSGGGAGIQADIKAVTYFKGYATTAVTAITSQNTKGVQAIFPVPIDHIDSQINSILDDLKPDVIKTGMLADKSLIKMIANKVQDNKLIMDPVMVATSGDVLVAEDCISVIKEYLLPKSFLITPNLYEAELLSNIKITSVDEQIEAAFRILELGAKNVLVKGGHSKTDLITDVLVQVDKTINRFESKKIDSKNTHGTGCSLASSIACLIGHDNDLSQSVQTAISYVQKGISSAPNFGSGNGPILHFDV